MPLTCSEVPSIQVTSSTTSSGCCFTNGSVMCGRKSTSSDSRNTGDAALAAADPEEHRFDVPEGCFWKDVRKESVDIGTILNTSFRAIEDANPRLKGVSVILPRSTSSPAWVQRRGRMGQLVPTLRMSGMPPSVGT